MPETGARVRSSRQGWPTSSERWPTCPESRPAWLGHLADIDRNGLSAAVKSRAFSALRPGWGRLWPHPRSNIPRQMPSRMAAVLPDAKPVAALVSSFSRGRSVGSARPSLPPPVNCCDDQLNSPNTCRSAVANVSHKEGIETSVGSRTPTHRPRIVAAVLHTTSTHASAWFINAPSRRITLTS